MKYYFFRILEGASAEEIEAELVKKGLKDSFIIEEDERGEIFIGGYSKKRIESDQVFLVEEKEPSVDWEGQWAQFAENFSEGKAHIQVGDQTLLLTPGAGFGDLSHPTTYLMLEMVKAHALHESIIDIGTGSGILALAALLLGAQSAIGIDIDAEAIKHAKQNARVNQLKARFSKSLPKTLPKENVLLMNMIIPEQRAFRPERLNSLAKLWITSGILASQREEYLEQTKQWGWEMVSEHQKGEWLGWVFRVSS